MFYVYHLIDPRTNAVFYVGKGSRNRIEAHEKEARGDSAHPKCQVIREIWAAGHQVQRVKVKTFKREQDAYDFEALEIERIGFDNLTNLMPGGQTARTAGAERVKPFSPLEAVLKFAGHVAYWLSKTDGGKIKNKIVYSGGDPKITELRNQCAEVVWTKLLPDLWARASSNPDDWPQLTKAFRPYGLELVFKESA